MVNVKETSELAGASRSAESLYEDGTIDIILMGFLVRVGEMVPGNMVSAPMLSTTRG